MPELIRESEAYALLDPPKPDIMDDEVVSPDDNEPVEDVDDDTEEEPNDDSVESDDANDDVDANADEGDPKPQVAAPPAPAPTFKFEGADIDVETATGHLANYEKMRPILNQARSIGVSPEVVLQEGMNFIGGNIAFEKDPAEAQGIIQRLIDAAIELHGDKFSIPDTLASAVNPEDLDAPGKYLFKQNRVLQGEVNELKGYVRKLALQLSDTTKVLDQSASASKDLSALHAAHPETVGVVDQAMLDSMKQKSKLTDPVAAYRYDQFDARSAQRSQVAKPAVGDSNGTARKPIPDAPKPGGARALVEFDADDPNVNADDILQAHLQGRPIKGVTPQPTKR